MAARLAGVIRNDRTAVGPSWARAGTRGLLSLLGMLLALVVGAALPGSALAVGPAFDAATPTVFIAQGIPTQLEQAVESNGQLVFQNVGPAAPFQYNAIAYDTVDNYIYGDELTSTPGEIIQIGSDGVPSDTGVNIGFNSIVGAWDPANHEVYFSSGNAANGLVIYDPATNTITGTLPLSANIGPDMTYAQGFFWGMPTATEIDRIDPATGTVTNFTVPTSVFPGAASGAGGAWTYGNGNLGFSTNTNGNIYQIAVSNPAAATPTFALVSHQPGPPNGNNDGAANPGLPTDLSMTKTASSPVADGGRITYTLSVTNHGPGNSSGYVVSDQLPADLSNPATSTPGCSISAGVLSCQGNPLTAGLTAPPITVTANVPDPFTTPITNTATVTANEQDPNPLNNTGTVTTTPQADLQMIKTASPSPVVPGTDETYTLEVENHGPDTARNVRVSDTLPSEASYVSSSSGCVQAGGTVTCTAASIAPGASATFTITTRLASSLAHCPANTATVTSATADPNSANNASTACPPLHPKANLTVSKLASTTVAPAGGQVMYTLVVNNNGPSDATGVIVSDAVPAGLTLVSAQPSQGSCSLPSSTCTLGAIADGGSAQILVTAVISSTASGTVTNCASATGDQQDPNAGDNRSCAGLTIQPPPQPRSDIAIDKKVNHSSAHPGQKLTYTLTVTNHGPDAAPNVRITDTASLSLKVLSAKPSRGSCHAGRPTTCSLGTLGAGAHATVRIVAEVMDTGTEKNTASSTCDCVDPNPHNNLDSAKTRITARLLLRKTATPGSVTTGHTVTFHLKVTNPNPVAVAHVKVCDRMPSGLSFVASGPNATRSHGMWCWKLGTIRKHSSRTVWIRGEAQLHTAGPVTNHATASAPGAQTAHARATVDVLNTANACGSARDVGAAGAAGSPSRVPIARIAC
jgi:uncharacterized repeat protein (TIGR01451 family)